MGTRPNGVQGKDAGLGVIHLLAVVLNAPSWVDGSEEKRRRVENKNQFSSAMPLFWEQNSLFFSIALKIGLVKLQTSRLQYDG